MNKLNNPFSDYGKVMSPQRFVGRKSEINWLQQRVLSEFGGGCVAIVGEARIGKTSLMNYVFRRDDPLVQSINGLVVSFNVGSLSFESVADFFASVVRSVQRELRRKSREDYELLKILADQVLEMICASESGWNIVLLEYFEEVGSYNYRIILLLDEFDSITRVFGENEAAFQLLRQLGYDNKYATVIVTTSRISIGQIEVQSLISTLSGIFSDVYLGLFDAEEYAVLFEHRLRQGPITFTKREQRSIRDFVGLHPYFAQIAAFHVWNRKADLQKEALTEEEIGSALDLCRTEIYEQFDNCKLRMGDKRFETLLAITQGPAAYSFSHFDLNRLLQQGHITEVQNGADVKYKPFGQVYDEYLKYHHRQIDLWPLWTKTEKWLRYLIGNRYEKLARNKGLSVGPFLQTYHADLFEKYCNYESNQQRELRYFSVTTTPFDYMNPSDIFDFIETNWDIFQNVFGPRDKINAWRDKFKEIRQVRNPYAHSRDYTVSETRRKVAESICHEIISLIERVESVS